MNGLRYGNTARYVISVMRVVTAAQNASAANGS